MKNAEEMTMALNNIEAGLRYREGQLDDDPQPPDTAALRAAAEKRITDIRNGFTSLVMRACTGSLAADKHAPARAKIVLGPLESRNLLGKGRPMVELVAYRDEETPLTLDRTALMDGLYAVFYYGSPKGGYIRTVETDDLDFRLAVFHDDASPPGVADAGDGGEIETFEQQLNRVRTFADGVEPILTYISTAAANPELNPL